MTGSAIAFSDVIANVTSVVTAAVGWVGQFMTVIETYPLLQIGFIVALVGLGVGLLSRLFQLR